MRLLTDATARRGRRVLAGREGQDDLVVGVWRTVRPKRLIGSLNRDTGVSPWGKVPMLCTGVLPAGLFADQLLLSNGPKKKRPVPTGPDLCVFRSMVAGLLTGSPVYAVRATFQAMSTVRMGCLLLVEAVAVVTGSDGIAIFTGRHALDPASRIRIL